MPKAAPKKIDLDRREMPKQDAEVRRQNFSEVALGYTAELAMEEARRCLQCKKKFCVENCPVQIGIPDFIRAIAQGDFAGGVRTLKAKNSLPSVCGRVCPRKNNVRKIAPWSTGGAHCHRSPGKVPGRLGGRSVQCGHAPHPYANRQKDGCGGRRASRADRSRGSGPNMGIMWSSLKRCIRWAASFPTESLNSVCPRKLSIEK